MNLGNRYFVARGDYVRDFPNSPSVWSLVSTFREDADARAFVQHLGRKEPLVNFAVIAWNLLRGIYRVDICSRKIWHPIEFEDAGALVRMGLTSHVELAVASEVADFFYDHSEWGTTNRKDCVPCQK